MSRASKRSYKWCGDAQLRMPESFANTSKGDIIVLCPTVGVNDYSDVVLERTIINFSIHREANAQLDGFSGIVAVQPIDQTNVTLPTQALDALSTTAAEYSVKNVLRWQALPVPAVVLEADNTAVPSSENIVVEWDIPVKRRLDRVRELLTLSMNTDVDNILQVFVQWRVLLSYGRR